MSLPVGLMRRETAPGAVGLLVVSRSLVPAAMPAARMRAHYPGVLQCWKSRRRLPDI
jgi:hypothetical protein